MALIGVGEQLRVVEQAREVVVGRQVFHDGEVREVEVEFDEFPRGVVIARGDLISFLGCLGAGVAMGFERGDESTDLLRLAHQAQPELRGLRRRGVVVGELDIDVHCAAFLLREKQRAKPAGVAGGDVTEEMGQAVVLREAPVLRRECAGDAVEAGGGDGADLFLQRPFAGEGRVTLERPECGDVFEMGHGAVPETMQAQRTTESLVRVYAILWRHWSLPVRSPWLTVSAFHPPPRRMKQGTRPTPTPVPHEPLHWRSRPSGRGGSRAASHASNDPQRDSDRRAFLDPGRGACGWRESAGFPELTMSAPSVGTSASSFSLHRLGVLCGLAAGAWLGIAEAPMKLVVAGFSPFVVTIGMVLGVFIARWTVPMLLKGAGYVFADVREKKHLIVWGLLAGMLWAVANTLTVFAIRDVGLSIAFPLWNVNSIIGLFWGWLLFNELRGGASRQRWLVLGGAFAIVAGACLTAHATLQASGEAHTSAVRGIMAAAGAALLWGTMYIPYRKAYLSGMNPLSFVTIFTFGELGTVFALAAIFDGGVADVFHSLEQAKPVLFWLFLGGFCWVIGDLFQQYAAKYIGISRGIPLSNTNQLWGLAWGALVFGELAHMVDAQALIVGGSLIMIAGAAAISFAEAPADEQRHWRQAMERECTRYGLDHERVAAAVAGSESPEQLRSPRRWWELVIVAAAVSVFVWLGLLAEIPDIAVNMTWLLTITVASLAVLGGAVFVLWRR